jgi:hypothetical protein
MPVAEIRTTVSGGRIARTYAETCDALATRMIELNVQQLALDEKCGLASGHTGKLLGPKPRKFYGPVSLDLHLEVLGLRIVIEPDPDRAPLLANTRQFLPRDVTAVLAARLRTREGHELLREHLRQAGRKGVAVRRRLAQERQEAKQAALPHGHRPQDQPEAIAIAG